MFTRLLLILALFLGQLSAGAVMEASPATRAASYDVETCCGGNCCCAPQACLCSAPVDDPQPQHPAPQRTSPAREQLTIASAPIIAIISNGDDHHCHISPTGCDDSNLAVTAPERLAWLCLWLT